jgi:site-specific recombinase XerD
MAQSRDYQRSLHLFIHHQHRQSLTFRDFPREMVGVYLDSLSPRNGERATYAIKAWLRFLHARKELLLALHEDLTYPRPRSRLRVPLSHTQVLQLLQLPPLDTPAGLRDRAFLEVAYATAMRKSELAALDLSDLDLAEGLATVRKSKNTHQRTVPLTRWAVHFLHRYLEQARPQLTSPLSLNALWLGWRGARFHANQMGIRLRLCYEVKEKLGFSVTLHQLRHTVATNLLAEGADVRSVQELLGHLDLQSTETYTHITPARLRQVHQRCHPRNRPGDPDFSGNF